MDVLICFTCNSRTSSLVMFRDVAFRKGTASRYRLGVLGGIVHDLQNVFFGDNYGSGPTRSMHTLSNCTPMIGRIIRGAGVGFLREVHFHVAS